MALCNKEQEEEERVSRFRDSNKTYRKIKSIAQEEVNRFFIQALKEPDKKSGFSIILSSMIEALRENPDRYDIIFNNDNDSSSNSTNNNAQKQDAVLEVVAKVSKALIERLVNETMNTLESQTEDNIDANADTDTESDVLEEAQDTVAAETRDIETATAKAKREETKSEADDKPQDTAVPSSSSVCPIVDDDTQQD